MTDTSLIVRIENGVAWLTLNRPEQRNALNIPLLQQLDRALADCAEDPAVRVVVLTGSGRSFCAGADLAEWSEAEARGELESYGWTETAHALMVRLYQIDTPTIAAVNGTAVGGGMDLSLCCDFRMAAVSARFKAGYTGMAYCPDAGASWHLPRMIGAEAAKRFLFLDELTGAAQALALGLVSEVLEDDQLLPAVAAFAARLASGPTFAYRQTKQLIRASHGRGLAEQLQAEQAAGLLCGRSEDAAEALRAVAEKRAPNFQGR